jgi:hypothetical protein
MKHQHVHRLLGVIIFKDQHLGMVSEWMENGNLREHMRNAQNFDRYQMVSKGDLVCISPNNCLISE